MSFIAFSLHKFCHLLPGTGWSTGIKLVAPGIVSLDLSRCVIVVDLGRSISLKATNTALHSQSNRRRQTVAVPLATAVSRKSGSSCWSR